MSTCKLSYSRDGYNEIMDGKKKLKWEKEW